LLYINELCSQIRALEPGHHVPISKDVVPMTRLQNAKLLGFALMVAVGASACGSDEPATTQLNSQNADAVAAGVLGALGVSVGGLTSEAVDVNAYSSLFGPGTFVQSTAGLRNTGGTLPSFSAPDGCPSFTPDPPPDTDQDGVPDNTLFSFEDPYCNFLDQTTGNTLFLRGSVRISDPASAVIGFDISFNQWAAGIVPAGGSQPDLVLTWDGTRSLRGQTSLITLDENFGFGLVVSGQESSAHTEGSLAFAPVAGSAIDFNGPLPDGTLDWNGTFQARGPEGFFLLSVTTVETLVYDSSCQTSRQANPGNLVGGVIRVAAASNDGAGAVQVTFQGCGVDPQVVFIGGTA